MDNKVFGMMEQGREKEKTINYIIMEKHGFYRPDKEGRKTIKKAFETIGIIIHGRGFDLIDKQTKEYMDKGILSEHIKKTVLYELKSTWRKDIKSDFKGFSYGITSNELKNADQLGNNFKIILLNGNTEKIIIQLFNEIGKNYSNTCHFFTVGKTNKSLDIKDLVK